MRVSQAESLFRQANRCASTQGANERRAWQLVNKALALDSGHADGRILAGDLLLSAWEDLDEDGLDDVLAASRALEHYQVALSREPRHADAWGGRARALNLLGRHQDALAAAQQGFDVLDDRVSYLSNDSVYQSVFEELCAAEGVALLGLRRPEEAEGAIKRGLERYPGSWYLNEKLDELRQWSKLDETSVGTD